MSRPQLLTRMLAVGASAVAFAAPAAIARPMDGQNDPGPPRLRDDGHRRAHARPADRAVRRRRLRLGLGRYRRWRRRRARRAHLARRRRIHVPQPDRSYAMTSFTRTFLAVALAVLALAPSAGAHPAVRSDAVRTWNANAGDAALAACLAPTNNPLHESRMYAAMHVAVHDALNAIERRSRPYAFATLQSLGASPDATVAAAARGVLVPLLKQLPAPFSSTAPRRASPASRPTMPLRSRRSRTVERRTRAFSLGQAAASSDPRPANRDGADTPLFDTAFPQGTTPGAIASRPGSRSPSRPAGRTSPRSCCGTVRSSAPVRPLT